MNAGILAAGKGERFRRAGISVPKPLIELGGQTLLSRAVEAAAEAGAERIAIIINEESPRVEAAVREGSWPLPIDLVVKRTASSMESFFALAPLLGHSSFLLLTVDAIFPVGTLGELVRAGLAWGSMGVLAVTEFADDEKPLRVRLDDDGRIVAFGSHAAQSTWITSGLYFFHPEVYDHVEEARRRRLGALRQYLALVLERGGRLGSFRVEKSIDVDRPSDLRAAERFLEEIA